MKTSQSTAQDWQTDPEETASRIGAMLTEVVVTNAPRERPTGKPEGLEWVAKALMLCGKKPTETLTKCGSGARSTPGPTRKSGGHQVWRGVRGTCVESRGAPLPLCEGTLLGS